MSRCIPAVSVVIATRNYGRYLAGAVQSVINQTWTDWELIVIDDGSTDDTPAVVRLFLTDPRIRYQRTDGLGQSRAKNLGIQLAHAPLIAFLDGDDDWLPEKLAEQLPLFANPAIGVVYSRRTLMDEWGRQVATPPATLVRGDVFDDLLVRNPVCFSSVVVRREVFEMVGMFDPSLPLAIDYDLWLRVARHFAFDYVDRPLVRYRTGHANLSIRIVQRLNVVLAVLQRALVRRGNVHCANSASVDAAWGSTCRTMGFVTRSQNPIASSRWYIHAARHDGAWHATIRSVAGVLITSMYRPRKVRPGRSKAS